MRREWVACLAAVVLGCGTGSHPAERDVPDREGPAADLPPDPGPADPGAGDAGPGDAGPGDSPPPVRFTVATDDPEATVRLEGDDAPGDTVRVRVVLDSPDPVLGLGLRVRYDAARFVLAGAEAPPSFGDGTVAMARDAGAGEVWIGSCRRGSTPQVLAGPTVVATLDLRVIDPTGGRVEIVPGHRHLAGAQLAAVPASWSGALVRAADAPAPRRLRAAVLPASGPPFPKLPAAAMRIPSRLAAANRTGMPPRRTAPSVSATRARYDLVADPAAGTLVVDGRFDLDCGTGGAASAGLLTADQAELACTLSLDDGPIDVQPSGWYGFQAWEIPLEGRCSAGAAPVLGIRCTSRPDCSSGPLGMPTCSLDASGVVAQIGDFTPSFWDPAGGESDPPAIELALTVPAGWSAVSVAPPVGVAANPDGTETHRFAGDRVSGVAFAAGPDFQVASAMLDGDGERPLRLLVRPPVPGGAAVDTDYWLARAREVMARFEDEFGPYRFGKLDLAEVLGATSPAAASPSLVLFPPDCLATPTADNLDRTLWTVAHELGHMWAGIQVGLSDPQSPWLQEAVNENNVSRWMEAAGVAVAGQDPTPIYREYWGVAYRYLVAPGKDVPMTGTGIVDAMYGGDFLTHYLITYLKGAVVVHGLETLVGRDAYVARLRGLWDGRLWRGIDLPSYLAAMEADAPGTLAEYIGEFVLGTGMPVVTSRVRVTPSSPGRWKASATLSSDRPFHLPLTVQFLGVDPVTGLPASRVLTVPTGAEPSTVDVELDFCPLARQVDPRVDFLRALRTDPPGDAVPDGDLDGLDLLYVAAGLGADYRKLAAGASTAPYYPAVDFDTDGDVDDVDLGLLRDGFGTRGGCE